jgi:hypothetical protein
MRRRSFPAGAKSAPLPSRVAFQLAVSSAEPPEGGEWLHEIKHDGHRLADIIDGLSASRAHANLRDTVLHNDAIRRVRPRPS